MESLRDRASTALHTIIDVIEEAVRSAPAGLRNSEVAAALGLETDVNGGQRNHLTHGLLARLCAQGRLTKEKRGTAAYYRGA